MSLANSGEGFLEESHIARGSGLRHQSLALTFSHWYICRVMLAKVWIEYAKLYSPEQVFNCSRFSRVADFVAHQLYYQRHLVAIFGEEFLEKSMFVGLSQAHTGGGFNLFGHIDTLQGNVRIMGAFFLGRFSLLFNYFLSNRDVQQSKQMVEMIVPVLFVPFSRIDGIILFEI